MNVRRIGNMRRTKKVDVHDLQYLLRTFTFVMRFMPLLVAKNIIII